MTDKAKKKGAPNPWLVTLTAGLAAFMEILDISIANVALTYIAGGLSTSNDEATWVLTSYLITNAVILLTSGWFATVIGRKRYFMACIAGFSATSLLCGLAPNLAFLIICRALQGLVGGGLQPSAQAILADAFPEKKRGMAFAIYGLAVVFAPAIGPTLGGWLTDNFSWRWVFLINVPVGILLTLLASHTIVDSPEAVAKREKQLKKGIHFDGVGFALIAIGMCSLQVVLDRGQIDDWFSSNLITSLSVSCVLGIALFIVWELITDDPIVDLSLFKNPNFAIGNILMALLGFVLLGSTVLLPEYSQEILGYTATDAGLVISPGGFFLALLMPIIGLLMSRVDARLLIGFGTIVCVLALLYMTNFDRSTDYGTIALSRVYQAGGLAFCFIPINTAAFQGVSKGSNNTASSIINMSRNVGGSIGISLMTTMLARREQVHQNILVRHVTDGSADYLSNAAGLKGYLASHWASQIDALHQGQAIIYRTLEQQARILAYIDDFQILAIVFFSMLPFLFFMRKPDPSKKAEPG